MDVMVEPTEYLVTCIPEGYADRHAFSITVVKRGPDSWAVKDRLWCVGKRGNRAYESNPSNRTDRFKKAYRFDLETALKIAKREAPKIVVNGYTIQDVLNNKWMEK